MNTEQSLLMVLSMDIDNKIMHWNYLEEEDASLIYWFLISFICSVKAFSFIYIRKRICHLIVWLFNYPNTPPLSLQRFKLEWKKNWRACLIYDLAYVLVWSFFFSFTTLCCSDSSNTKNKLTNVENNTVHTRPLKLSPASFSKVFELFLWCMRIVYDQVLITAL